MSESYFPLPDKDTKGRPINLLDGFIEGEWQHFVKNVYPDVSKTDTQYAHLKLSWFAASHALLHASWQLTSMDSISNEMKVKVVEAWTKEAHDYCEKVQVTQPSALFGVPR